MNISFSFLLIILASFSGIPNAFCSEEILTKAAQTSKTTGKKAEKKAENKVPMKPEQKPEQKSETAVLAAGCFWGVEDILRKLDGVLETEVGYTGGTLENPVYEKVKLGNTGHAEAVRIVFNPAKISFEQILGYFFRLHDPTQLNRQQNDVGTQYRSAIFFMSEEQRMIAEKKKAEVNASGKWKNPVATVIVKFEKWWPAEAYHQDYLVKNPNGYTCHYLRD